MEKTLLVIEPMLKDMSNAELMEVKNAELHHSTNEKWGKRWNKKVDTLDAYGEMETLVGMIDDEISLRKSQMTLPILIHEIDNKNELGMNEGVLRAKNIKDGVDILMNLTDEMELYPMPYDVSVTVYSQYYGPVFSHYELHFVKATEDSHRVLHKRITHKDVEDSDDYYRMMFESWF